MINHPLLKSRAMGLGYLIAWLFIYLFGLGLHYYNHSIVDRELILSQAVYCLTFAFLGISVWYSVNSCFKQRNTFALLFNQATSAIVFVLIWFVSSRFLISFFGICKVVDEEQFNKFLPLIILIGFAGYVILMLVYYLYMYSVDLEKKHENEVKLQNALKEVEIGMLRAQINPHFLFNSLNSVSSLTMIDPDKAQQMVVKLSDYLRYTVSQTGSGMVSLNTELENISRYLEIEKVRFGSKLVYIFSIEEQAKGVEIPAMILQPLFENAIKYGVYESTEPITVETTAKIDEEALLISIKNNYQSGTPMTKGAGIGLKNIAERLKLIYYNDTLVKIKDSEGTFEVVLIIPMGERKK